MNSNLTQRQKASEKILEAMFEYAGACHVENIAEEIEDEDQVLDQIPYPSELDKKMRKLINGYNKKLKRKRIWGISRRIFTKVATFIFIFILGISMLAVGVEAFRARVLNFIIEIQDEYTSIGMKSDNSHMSKDAYIPVYSPKGFSITKTENLSEAKIMHYSNDLGEVIVFNQYDNKNVDLRIDTENAKTDKIMLHEIEGMLVDKDGFITIVWHNNEYLFMLMGKTDKNELIKMAESIKSKK